MGCGISAEQQERSRQRLEGRKQRHQELSFHRGASTNVSSLRTLNSGMDESGSIGSDMMTLDDAAAYEHWPSTVGAGAASGAEAGLPSLPRSLHECGPLGYIVPLNEQQQRGSDTPLSRPLGDTKAGG